MESSKVSLRPDKFTGKDWSLWKEQMQAVFMLEALWEIVDGSVPQPDDDAGEADHVQWKRKDNRALAMLKLLLDNSQLVLVMGCETASEAWQQLVDRYEQPTMQNIILRERKYRDCRMNEGDSMQEHINKHKMLIQDLAAVGSHVPEQRQVMELILSLPPSYDPLVNSLQLVQEGLTMKLLTGQLLLEEQKRKERNAGDSGMAMYSARSKVGASGYRGNLKMNRGKVQSTKGAKACFNCKELGHFKKNCPLLQQERSGNRKHEKVYAVGLLAGAERGSHEKWFVDSGASVHMCCSEKFFTTFQQFACVQKVTLPDGNAVHGIGSGKVKWDSRLGDIELHDVMLVPDFNQNLVSVKKMTEKGATVTFNKAKVEVSLDGNVVATGQLDKSSSGALYMLDGKPNMQENFAHAVQVRNRIEDWHKRLGHASPDTLVHMAKEGLVDGLQLVGNTKMPFCETCQFGKQTRNPFPKEAVRSKKVLELIHSDVCGPMPVNSVGGSRYFVTFVDDCTRYTAVYFMNKKSEVLKYFREFHREAELVTGCKVKCIRSDNGTEYVNGDFDRYLKECGIQRQLSAPFSPQQNGVAERVNRTLLNSARSMLHYAGLPEKFWAEAVLNATYVKNRVSTKAVNEKVPYEAFWDRKPSVGYLRIFGCDAYAHVPKVNRKKLDSRSKKVTFLGYDLRSKAYRLWDFEKNQLVISRDVKFNEGSFNERIFHQSRNEEEKSTVEIEWEIMPEAAENENDEASQVESEQSSEALEFHSGDTSDQEDITENARRPVRRCQPAWMRSGDFLVGKELDEQVMSMNAESVRAEPKTVQEALSSPQAKLWQDAMQAEYDSLMKNGVFKLVKLPNGRDVLDNKWVFKIKRNSDGTIQRYKARLVARGFSQQPGVDFTETYSPVTRLTSVRTVLAIANQLDMDIHQMDVQTAFLNGKLEQEIYMKQPTGFPQKGNEDLVCKLEKGLYGLKQSARCWYQLLNDYLQKTEYQQCPSDPCVYWKRVGSAVIIIAIHVDDLIIASNEPQMLKREKEVLSRRFAMHDLGEAHFILGMKITRDKQNRRLWLTQGKYLSEVIEKFGMKDCKIIATPQQMGQRLEKNNDNPVNMKEYQALIGSLTYAAMSTRPDITEALNVVSQFASNPNETHWKAAKRILRYLKGTLDYGICFCGSSNKDVKLSGFVDADWAGDVETRKSQSGYVFYLCGGPVSWVSRKQTVVALSTTEAEYVAAAFAAQELIWLRKLLQELGFQQKMATVLFEDSTSAIEVSRNPKFHGRMKHIDIRHHFLRDAVEAGTLILQYCQTDNQLADIMTKALPRDKFETFRKLLGVQKL